MNRSASIPAGVQAVSVLVGGEQTHGNLGLVDETLSAEFGGPPLHVHPSFDELFYVLEGDPRGTPHTFANHSDQPARTLIAVTPAGFERYFRLVAAELTGIEPSAAAFGPRPVTEHVGPPITRNPG